MGGQRSVSPRTCGMAALSDVRGPGSAADETLYGNLALFARLTVMRLVLGTHIRHDPLLDF